MLVALAGCGRIDFDETVGVPDGPTGPPSGLIAWWKLDEGTGTITTDAIGGVQGQFKSGSGLIPTWTAGHTGGGVDFAGDGDNITADPTAAFDNMAALTISAWLHPSSVTNPGNSDLCVVDKGTGLAGWTFTISTLNDGDLGFTNVYGASVKVQRASPAGVIAVGVWTHVVASWDGTTAANGIRLFVNGLETLYLSPIDGGGARPDDAAEQLSINCNSSSGLVGIIDDVQLYDRVLSPAEIATL